MARFYGMAEHLRNLDEASKIKIQPSTPGIFEEEKKGEEIKQEDDAPKKTTETRPDTKKKDSGIVASTLTRIIESKPWIKLLADEKSQFF